MKRKLAMALCAAILGCALLTGAFALDFQLPVIEDMLIKHRVFLSDQTGDYSEFLIVFFGDDTHKLMQISDEIIFYPSSGIRANDLTTQDFEDTYPGISTMRCADVVQTQRDDGCFISIRFCNLKDNWRELVQNGILIAQRDGEYMDADSICDDLIAKGMQEIDNLHLDQYNLDYSYVD